MPCPKKITERSAQRVAKSLVRFRVGENETWATEAGSTALNADIGGGTFMNLKGVSNKFAIFVFFVFVFVFVLDIKS